MTIEFGRAILNHCESATSREWLITNGIGSYASGTIAGTLTRRYHGLLVAALKPPLERTFLLAKLDETAHYDDGVFPLSSNHWRSGAVDPKGFLHLERFHLEGTTPVWTYALADALLEKRIWMQPGENTTYIRYDLKRGTYPLTISLKALVDYRGHHATMQTNRRQMQITPLEKGLSITAFENATPFYLLSDRAEATAKHEWYRDYYLRAEAYRGLDPIQYLLCAGEFRATLQAGESLTFLVSTEANPNPDGAAAFQVRQNYERELLSKSSASAESPEIQQLVLAADQFIVDRPSADDPNGKSIIAGYPWFGDWGRDTMIALSGLTLTTGRPEVARSILRTFARHVDRGMIPNRFPEVGEQPEYNTVDASLWYFEALRAYHAHTNDDDLLRELFPVLQEIIAWHQRGTRYQIHVDPEDGLLYAGEEGVQLTWMDAKVGDWVVTPRIGKPVEINALWYNALRIMADFSKRLDEPAENFVKMAEHVSQSFSRFWNNETNHCLDVLAGPQGDDPSLRPNQLFAVSLHHSPLTPKQQRAVVDVCARHLLTSHGLRSLAPDDKDYIGHYGGDQHRRDASYHQGIVWGWLIGPFVQAHLRVYGDADLARSFLSPLLHHLKNHGVGSLSEIFDGNPPFTPRGCFAQAWSVAEVLRVWELTDTNNPD
ncbi:MAG: amylo-alpha-1,6-glucosidase [Anaerolineales bacterium]|nr:amylo-alpha-1,6-glucosidase [Anaerolineales bacterium]